ncbi:hypothetical protein KGQ31_03650, partial [Patescibacteria group bacterium]|nr:hypothetical protein [Patescibacteria group bacterium]
MKLTRNILVLFLLSLLLDVASAQTSTNPPTISGGLQEIYDAATSSTNSLVEVHALYAPALSKKTGGGIGYFWLINQYAYTGVRLDYVNGGFWMPSGNAALQLPLHPLSKLTFMPTWLSGVKVTPFAYGGIGIPVSGAVVGDVTIPGSVHDNNG